MTIEDLASKGIKISYVRFQAPVAPSPKHEPVYEFKLSSDNHIGQKYVVHEIVFTTQGLIWKHNEKWNLSPLPNVLQVW